jgi:PAS domain S-box-containing protein
MTSTGADRPGASLANTSVVLTYVSAIGCIGAGVIGHSLWHVSTHPIDWNWLWLAALTVASSAAVLQLSSTPVAFSIAEIFTFSAALLFGPEVGALTVAIDCAVISWRLAIRGLPWRRVILNVTAPPLAMWLAAHLLFALVDVGRHVREPLLFAELVWPLTLSAIVYYLLDTWMIAVAVALDERRRVWQVWRDHFVQLWVSFLVGAHAAGLIVVALGGLGFSFLAIVAPFPLLLYYAMRTWVARINDRVCYLQEANQQSEMLRQQQSLRLQTEVALRERDRQFLAVFDYALDALLLVDDERRLLDANPAACVLLDVSRDALPVAPIDDFLARDSSDEMRAQWGVRLAGDLHHGELVVTAGGRTRMVEFSFKAGVVPGRHLFIWRDVSERKRLEAQLQQAQKMETVGRLAGGVAHDFNNLLTVIIGNAGLVLEREATSPNEEIREIIAAAERAATLTRQLLAFSRKQVLQTSVVNLNGVIGGVEKMLRRLLVESIELHHALEPALWPVKVDVAQLEQVIVNLVVNARDAMPDGGLLVLETSNVEIGAATHGHGGDVVPGSYARLTVTDTGTGMDEPTRSQIFEPFFTTKEQDRGTGLGLAMAYGVIRQSGGHIVVESTPGAGSTFAIYLPRVERPVRVDVLQEDEALVRSGGAERVLLVEDEGAVRTLACRTLRQYGYEVLAAASGKEACRLAADSVGTIDVLVTDMVMPKMNGQELAATLRGRIAGLKVVFMSGYAGEALALETSTTDTVFLQKPFTPLKLARTVRDVLDCEARVIASGHAAPPLDRSKARS